MVEAVAESDDQLLEKYLAGEDDHRRRADARRCARATIADRAARRCSAARRSRTRACSRCSTRSSTTCRRRSTSRRSRASTRTPTQPVDARSRRRRAVRGAGVQDHDRPVRRPARLLPRLLGHARAGDARATTPPSGTSERIGRLLQDARQQARGDRRGLRRRHRRGGRPRRASRPATRSATRSTRSCSRRWTSPSR